MVQRGLSVPSLDALTFVRKVVFYIYKNYIFEIKKYYNRYLLMVTCELLSDDDEGCLYMKQRETKDPNPELYGPGRLNKLTNFRQRRSTMTPVVALFIMLIIMH